MKYLAVCILLFSSVGVFAQDGYVFGENHCYYFTAPERWVLDNRALDVPMMFYPKGRKWEDSLTVFYTRPADFIEGAKTHKNKIKAQVDQIVNDFKKNGSPDSKAIFIGKIKSDKGSVGELWKFTGDRWGNTEFAAYFVGKSTVNFFVMTSRDKVDPESALQAFLALARSYREADDCVPCETKKELACRSQ